MRTPVLVAATVLWATLAEASPRRSRRSDRSRVKHAVVVGGIAALNAGVELAFKDQLTAEACRWCNPPGFDVAARNALKWKNTERADLLSDLTGIYGAPLFAIGSLMASTWCQGSGRQWFDDVIPVVASAVGVSVITQLAKVSAGRQRPFVHFGNPAPDSDDNMSFYSGHTSFSFSLAVSAGVVAHQRGYRLEPLIWAGGLGLATTTGLLRVAADKHYATDVLVGATMGTAAGIAIPLLFYRDDLATGDLTVIPTGTGLALAWTF